MPTSKVNYAISQPSMFQAYSQMAVERTVLRNSCRKFWNNYCHKIISVFILCSESRCQFFVLPFTSFCRVGSWMTERDGVSENIIRLIKAFYRHRSMHMGKLRNSFEINWCPLRLRPFSHNIQLWRMDNGYRLSVFKKCSNQYSS